MSKGNGSLFNPERIRAAIEGLRRRLVDLSASNRMLSFKHFRRSTLSVVNTHPHVLFEALLSGRQARFIPVPEPELVAPDKSTNERNQPQEGVAKPQEKPEARDHARRLGIPVEFEMPREPGELPTRGNIPLQTLHYDARLETVLTHIRRQAASVEQESGSNMLNLVFGFLEWRPSDDSDSSYLAPLLTLPVRLERNRLASSGRYVYSLNYDDVDLETNVSLYEKLRHDFDLDLPEVDEQTLLHDYYRQIERLVAHKKGWRIANRVTLGMLNFRKLVMYRDLEPDNTWLISKNLEDHPLLRQLLGNPEGEADNDPGFATIEPLDDVEEKSLPPLVLDADSSQHTVLRDALAGKSMAVEGPPGTGKSQTIANLIAAAINDGKTVLFVAEKRAALEVVHRRLQLVGLAPFCLELHSEHTNRKKLLSDLDERLRTASPQIRQSDVASAFSQLDRAKKTLVEYGRILHHDWKRLDRKVYEILWERFRSYQEQEHNLVLLEDLNIRNAASHSRENLDEARETVSDYTSQLQALKAEYGSPRTHPWYGVESPTIQAPSVQTKLIKSLEKIKTHLADVKEKSKSLETATKIQLPGVPSERIKVVDGLMNMPGSEPQGFPDLLPKLLGGPKIRQAARNALDVIQRAAEFRGLRNHLCSTYRMSKDINSEACIVAAGVLTTTGIFGRIFSPAYYKSRSFHVRLMRDNSPMPAKLRAKELEKMGSFLRHMAELDLDDNFDPALEPNYMEGFAKHRSSEISGGERKLKEYLGQHYAELVTDTKAIEITIAWAEALEETGLPAPWVNWIGGEEYEARSELLQKKIPPLHKALQKLEDAHITFLELGSIDLTDWYGQVFGLSLDKMELRTEKALGQQGALKYWADYAAVRPQMQKLQPGIFELAETEAIPPEELASAYSFVFYNSLAEELHSRIPELARFNAAKLEQAREEFRTSDRQLGKDGQMNARMAAVRMLTKHPPEGITHGRVGGLTEMGLLRNELGKTRRYVSIRRLLERAIRTVQTIKPCFMMSPLSVAQYLPPERAAFDLVIMDEASQMYPEEALGAIARGRQILIAGDTKQLPPTSFFARHLGAEAIDEEEADDVVSAQEAESILDAAKVAWAPPRMLNWHYRSRHHSLISFSNQRFYSGRLVVTPAPMDKRPDLGVHYIFVPDGHFQAGRNFAEAHRVIELGMNHIRTFPNRSLGIVTMNFHQQEYIEDGFDRLRIHDEALQAFEENHSNEEPLLIKNLENVQGDERDTIIISMTYGRGAEGVGPQQFGPILRQNGSRRLNVLFTRAKFNVIVVSSINPDQLKVTGDPLSGVRVMKDYLTYARDGRMDGSGDSMGDTESPFEEGVMSALENRGHDVESQIGVGAYRIDLGVRHPDLPGKFLLGIECDGASYHSHKSTRDRDRLRQEILEDMGWHLHRIWSTDWFRDPDRQMQRLIQRIDSRLKEESGIAEEKFASYDLEEKVREDETPEAELQSGEILSIQDTQPGTSETGQSFMKLRSRLESLQIEFEKEFPKGSDKIGLLDEPVLTLILEKLPISREEWSMEIPLDIRQTIDGSQNRQYLDQVLEVIDEMTL